VQTLAQVVHKVERMHSSISGELTEAADLFQKYTTPCLFRSFPHVNIALRACRDYVDSSIPFQ